MQKETEKYKRPCPIHDYQTPDTTVFSAPLKEINSIKFEPENEESSYLAPVVFSKAKNPQHKRLYSSKIANFKSKKEEKSKAESRPCSQKSKKGK